MVCLATTDEARAAAIDLARQRNLKLEEKLKAVTKERDQLQKAQNQLRGVTEIATVWQAFAESNALNLTQIEIDGKHGGSVSIFESEATTIAYQAFSAGWTQRVTPEEYDPFGDE